MVCMEQFAAKDVFEEKYFFIPEEEPFVRRYYDFSCNYEEMQNKVA